jgi:hypothetical protein
MRAFLVGLVSSLIALAGFAGLANASATIDLLWAANGTNTISSVATSSSITLNVVLTAGAGGSAGGGVSVDYSTMVASGDFIVTGFSQPYLLAPLGSSLGATTNFGGTQIRNINAVDSFVGGPPFGLLAGQSHLMGTITFQNVTGAAGSFQVDSLLVGTDGLSDGSYGDISGTSTFNSAFAVVPEPGTLSLLGMGLGGLYVVGRRSSQKR